MTRSPEADFVRDVVTRGGNQPKIATNKRIGDYRVQ